jgi:hypothetical protein
MNDTISSHPIDDFDAAWQTVGQQYQPAIQVTSALIKLNRPQRPQLRRRPAARCGRAAPPEPDFYMIGMKSYGRAATFLPLTGTSRPARSSQRWRATGRLRGRSSSPCLKPASAPGQSRLVVVSHPRAADRYWQRQSAERTCSPSRR